MAIQKPTPPTNVPLDHAFRPATGPEPAFTAPPPRGIDDEPGPIQLPGGFVGPPPQGPALEIQDLPSMFQGSPWNQSSTPLIAPEVICNRCRFGHIFVALGDTANVEHLPDGTTRRFVAFHGTCGLFPQAPKDLDELTIVRCNQFVPINPDDKRPQPSLRELMNPSAYDELFGKE